jgi:hypothetical protein
MNPYLERTSVWHDFHERFVPALAETIGACLEENFVVRIDDHIFIHELTGQSRRLIGRSDVGVSGLNSPAQLSAGVATIPAPAHVDLVDVDEERLSFVEIRDRDSWRLITILELLSPTNKYQGPDREQYLAKRRQILGSPTHLVEIDLLRGGPRMPMVGAPAFAYGVLVSRWQQRPRAELWPVQLRERLPEIPVPLSEAHADVRLDLQALVHRIYDAARYGNYIYRGEPEPQLNGADQDWAKALVPARP